MNFICHIKLRTRQIFLLGLSALALVISIGVAASLMRQRMFDDRVDKLRGIAQATLGIAQSLENQVAAHRMTHDQALDQFREAAHVIRFDAGSGYVVAQTLETSMIMVHGANPNLDGKPTAAKAASETGTAAGQVLTAASDLSTRTEQLSSEVGDFVAGVRAA